MKQKIIIPQGKYKLENKYEEITPNVAYSSSYLRGYSITPTDTVLFKKLANDKDKIIVLDFDDKKDPRRSKSTKKANNLLFCFRTVFENEKVQGDLIINQPEFSNTAFLLSFNQWLLENNQDLKQSQTFTFNGALGRIIIDRSNLFKTININNNNKTGMYSMSGIYYRKFARISIVDNTLEELNITNAKNLNKEQIYNIDIDTLKSYSLKKIKLEGNKFDIASNPDKIILKNLEELDLSKIEFFEFRYNSFFRQIAKNKDKYKNLINMDMKIKINPLSKCSLHTSSLNPIWLNNPDEGYEHKPISVKDALNLKSNEITEIKFKDIIAVIQKEEELRNKKINNKVKDNLNKSYSR